MPLDNDYHKHRRLASTSCYHLDADDELEPIMLIHDDQDDDHELVSFAGRRRFGSARSSGTGGNRLNIQAAPVFLRGCLSSLSGKRVSPLARPGASVTKNESIASNYVISPSASSSSLSSASIVSSSEQDDDNNADQDDFMTINFAPSEATILHEQQVADCLLHRQRANNRKYRHDLTPPTTTTEDNNHDQHSSSGSCCWLCGCNWQQDHISLDCCECGGYALTRPCPKCDGACKQVWERNIKATHDHHRALWRGNCALANCNNGKVLEQGEFSSNDEFVE